MLKPILFTTLLGTLLTSLTGCVVETTSPYAASQNNIASLQQIKAHPIALGSFTDPKKTVGITCRAGSSEEPPHHESYAAYIKDALKKELQASKLYRAKSSLTLDATLNKIDFSSGKNSAYWIISMTFDDHHQAPYQVSSQYKFLSSSIGLAGCKDVARALTPATQQFLATLYSNPAFKRTLRLGNK